MLRPSAKAYLACFAILFCIDAAFAFRQASATQLDKPACNALAEQMQSFKALDVPKLMEKGPEWAVANLSPGDLDLIRRYIDVDEQIRFRCTEPGTLVKLKGQDEDDEEEAAPKIKQAGAASALPKAKQKPQKQPRTLSPQRKSGQPTQATLHQKPGSTP